MPASSSAPKVSEQRLEREEPNCCRGSTQNVSNALKRLGDPRPIRRPRCSRDTRAPAYAPIHVMAHQRAALGEHLKDMPARPFHRVEHLIHEVVSGISLWNRSLIELTKTRRGLRHVSGCSSLCGRSVRSNPCSNGCPVYAAEALGEAFGVAVVAAGLRLRAAASPDSRLRRSTRWRLGRHGHDCINSPGVRSRRISKADSELVTGPHLPARRRIRPTSSRNRRTLPRVWRCSWSRPESARR